MAAKKRGRGPQRRPVPARGQAGSNPGGKAGARPGAAKPAGAAQPGAAKPGAAGGGGGQPAAKARDKPTQAQRLAAVHEARRRQSKRRRLLALGAVVVAGAVVVGFVVADRRADARLIERLEAAGCAYDTRADPTDPAPGNHVASPTYSVDPPAGGNHLVNAAGPAVYGPTDLPLDGRLVHAQEHGDVVLWHRPDLGADALNQLEAMFDRYQGDVLVVPRPSLTVPVAATAWERRLLCSQPDRDSLDLFVRSFRDKGPEKVPE